MKFRSDNEIGYRQDFRAHRTIPPGVDFEVTKTKELFTLTGPGYGQQGQYGNGSLTVSANSLSRKQLARLKTAV